MATSKPRLPDAARRLTKKVPDPPPEVAVDARERLLQAGLQMALEGGLRAMTVRALAQRAAANLGSFVYHFGTRDRFIETLIERLYAPMFQRLQALAATGAPADALLTLRGAILQLVSWLQDNRVFVARLLMDAAAGEAAARRFLAGLEARHPALLLQLIQQAQQAGRLQPGDAAHQLLFLMSSLALPVLAFELVLSGSPSPPPLLQRLAGYALDRSQTQARLDWALRGLAPQGA
ncbi:MAG: TetR/AcrR family transcriptional regulator [Rubrivivax sp.]|nr:TetR/AcrR family transcriptional regulator [Rubrivivax sp.]